MIPLTNYLSGLTLKAACCKLADHHAVGLETVTLSRDQWNEIVRDCSIESLEPLIIHLRTKPEDALYEMHLVKWPCTKIRHLVVVHVLELGKESK